ncbi:MAG: tetratricopeptide repeat protein [Caldilineaceae bacterium]|nr:tetratricopeptide repeat protein [Caldilineaceae bacterium]
MKTPIESSLQQIITERTGLLLRDSELGELSRHVAARMAALKISDGSLFLARLATDNEEWSALYKVITTGESYFLRDQGQIALLRSHILPELLERRSQERTLSVWSAGCSTGEEVYSLAILLDQIATERSLDLTGWRINLLGTDLNPQACRHAEAGIYGKWSFRGVAAEVQSRYFIQQKHDEWRVNNNLRRFVHFRPLNLSQDFYPPAGSVDLILCRNVLIYFADSAIAQVVDKFSKTLRPGGYLLTGHGELQGQLHTGLTAQFLPGSTVYRPQGQPPVARQPIRPKIRQVASARPVGLPHDRPRAASVPAPALVTDARSSQIREWLATAQTALDRGDANQATQLAERILAQTPSSVPAYLILARAQANLGQLSQAKELCHKAIKIDPLSPQPHYLLAHIAQESMDSETARQHYQKTLYLDPSFVPALLELSMLLDQPNEQARSRQLRRSAREQLLTLSPDQRIAPYAESAGQLLAHWTGEPETTHDGQTS